MLDAQRIACAALLLSGGCQLWLSASRRQMSSPFYRCISPGPACSSTVPGCISPRPRITAASCPEGSTPCVAVTGIKRIEGRTWSTKHRGRLWIHATSATPSPDDIQVGARRMSQSRHGPHSRSTVISWPHDSPRQSRRSWRPSTPQSTAKRVICRRSRPHILRVPCSGRWMSWIVSRCATAPEPTAAAPSIPH